MNASALAHEIWGDLWEFGRIALILMCGLLWGWFVRNRMGNDEGPSGLVGVLLIAACSVGAFGLFVFLNIQIGDILRLARTAPLWGAFSALSLMAVVASVGLVAHRQLGTTHDETNLSILNVQRPSASWFSSRGVLQGLCVALLSASILFGWLWLIAHGRAIR
jgi:hypothetical protein